MKLFHISDLHIGKQLNNYSLKENQEEVLDQIVEAMETGRPDALIIAGDIYDKSVPSGEAYEIFDAFLNRIGRIEPAIPVFIIAGNHDSPERLDYASGFLEKHHIYISVRPPEKQDEFLKRVTLYDDFGPVHFYFLPFTKPGHVRSLFPDREISDYEKAVETLIERENINYHERNVVISHQFYQSRGWDTATCDSEQQMLSVGGLDRVDISLLRNFDYAALGHLHGTQQIKLPHIRYSGSPLKYSVSEEHHKKSITEVKMGAKGEPLEISMIPLTGLRDVRSERGSLDEIIERAVGEKRNDFVSITLTDETEPYRMKERLREVYAYLLEIRVDNQRVRKRLEDDRENEEELSPFRAFEVFYEEMTKTPLSREEGEIIEKVLDNLTEEGL